MLLYPQVSANNQSIPQSKDRELSFDLLKCFAIFLVIWQHCIFNLGYGIDMLSTSAGRAISMVNMPLFMFIVGYFSKSSILCSFGQMVKKKWHTLLLPMLIYCGIQYLIEIHEVGITPPHYKSLILSVIRPYWFIWALMYSILWFRLFRIILPKLNLALVSAASFVVLMLIPRDIFVPHFMSFQSMYPFFLMGFISKRYNLLSKFQTSSYKWLIVVLSFLVFASLYIVYRKENFFYFFLLISTPEWIKSFIMMLIAGFVGIIISYSIADTIAHKNNPIIKWTAEIGKYTFAIYMIQGILCKITDYTHYEIFNQFVLLAIALAVFLLLSELTLFLRKFRSAAKYLLGKIN